MIGIAGDIYEYLCVCVCVCVYNTFHKPGATSEKSP